MKVADVWTQLPMTYYYEYDDPQAGPITCEASIEVATLPDKGVRIFWTQSDWYNGTNVDPVDPYKNRSFDFKIVAIEASQYENRSDVNYSDYNAVKAAFQLAD